MQTLAARIRSNARISGHFILRSGLTSDTYFDKYQFESDPVLLLAIAHALAGLEMGGIPIVTMLSQVTGIPAAFIRKEPKAYGTCRYAEGASLQGRRFILIEDVVSSGGALVDAVAKLKADGMVADLALCVIDRQSGGTEALQAVGLALKAAFTFAEIERG